MICYIKSGVRSLYHTQFQQRTDLIRPASLSWKQQELQRLIQFGFFRLYDILKKHSN